MRLEFNCFALLSVLEGNFFFQRALQTSNLKHHSASGSHPPPLSGRHVVECAELLDVSDGSEPIGSCCNAGPPVGSFRPEIRNRQEAGVINVNRLQASADQNETVSMATRVTDGCTQLWGDTRPSAMRTDGLHHSTPERLWFYWCVYLCL